MKRFYKLVSVNQEAEGWTIHLDTKPVKTPGRVPLLASSEALANAVAGEWMAQETVIDPESMPLTQILSTQIDQVQTQRDAMSAEVLKYLNTDLLCYRAGKEPEGQAEKQIESWDPWLEWFQTRFETPLETTIDLVALKQPPAAHEAVKAAVEALDDVKFTVLQLTVPLSGSLVLSLAFVEGAITPQQIFDATHVEEHFKDAIYDAEKHGIDPLQEKKDVAMMRDLEAAAEFLKLV